VGGAQSRVGAHEPASERLPGDWAAMGAPRGGLGEHANKAVQQPFVCTPSQLVQKCMQSESEGSNPFGLSATKGREQHSALPRPPVRAGASG